MKDPAFLFYDGDAARDVSHMNRLERGCYFDLIQAQRKYHGITAELARKILGNDFDTCWEALEIVLTKDSEGKYYIEWVRNSILKSAKNSKIQQDRIQKYWDTKKKGKEIKASESELPRNYRGNSADIPIVTETKIKNKEGLGGKKEEDPVLNLPPSESEILYGDVIGYFTEDLQPKSEKQKSEWVETLDKLIRIDGHPPELIKQVIKNTRADPFWKSNFLSVLKLRRKDKDSNTYFTVFKSRINGNNRSGDERKIERVNQYWDKTH